MTIVHSDSTLGAIAAFLVVVAMASLLVLALVRVVYGEYRRAVKTLLALCAFSGIYIIAVMTVSLMTPRKIVTVGQSYCYDIWCIGIEKVTAVPQGEKVLYTTDVRIFSDANRVQTSAKGASIFLVDDRGRRFPMIEGQYDMVLDPRQSVHTSLKFLAPADARQLFLTGDSGNWSLVPSLGLGNDASLLHKRTLLRVM
jgi:hypothetical protein